jgi:hypothetical protein
LLKHSENNLNSEKLLRRSLNSEGAAEDNCSARVNGEPGQVTDVLFDQKLELATEGLEPYYLDHLKTRLSKENALTISKYILSKKVEVNLSSNHRRAIVTSLKLLSAFFKNKKSFEVMNQENILLYLDISSRSFQV